MPSIRLPCPLRSLSRFVLLASLLTASFAIPSPQTTYAGEESAPLSLGDSLTAQYISTGGNHSCGLKQEGGIFCWGANSFGQTNVPVYIPTSINDNFTQVSAGATHTCGLRDNGTITCWGNDGSGQVTIPSPNNNYTQISAGGNHTCGRKTGGILTCWGSNSDGQLTIPGSNSGFTHVSSGGSHTCARRSGGTIECWGSNTDGQVNVPGPNSNFSQVVSGQSHSCGRKTDGSVVCWGSNTSGQTSVPNPNTQFDHVSAGYTHTCGFKGDGSIVCWGSNVDGEGNVPAPNGNFAQVSAGGGHSCGLKDDGRVVCWGDNSYYESDPFANYSDPLLPIRAGQYNSCILRNDNSVFCWGRNNVGQSNSPISNSSFVEISSGGQLSCGRKSDGSMVCWGVDYLWQITVPSPNSNFTQISVGDRHGCGLKSDNSISCTSGYIWGDPPAPNNNFMNVGSGGEHTCGVTTDLSSILCWGYNTYGQSSPPAPIDRWIEVSAGLNHTCGQNRIPGPVQCWGLNTSGQSIAPAPTNDFFTVSAGGQHSCAVHTTGFSFYGPVACWGDNTSGQTSVPGPNSRFLSISAGGSHTCGRRALSWSPRIEESVCWGDDTYGQSTLALTKFTVPPINQPPTANNDSYSALEDTLLVIPAAMGVLDNDNDPENDALSAVEQSPPSNGTLNLASDGSFDYTPNANYCGSDSFTYLARTALADSNIATVNINITCINDTPSFTASNPSAVNEDAGGQTVSGWATFSPGPIDESAQGVQQYIVSNISNPALFSASPAVNTSGVLSYTPSPNAFGTSTFDVQVQDDGGTANGGMDTSPTQQFTINVNPVGDPPTTTGIADVTVLEDAADTIIDLWPSFTDVEDTDDLLTYSVTGNTNASLFTSTDVTGSPNQYLTLDYAPDQNGSANITVRSTDTGTLWVETTFQVTITPVNDPPSFTPGTNVTVPVNSGAYTAPWASAIAAGPSNESGQALTFQVINDNNGLFTVQPAIAPNGRLTFTPVNGAVGSAHVAVALSDNGGTANGGFDTSSTVIFTITVALFPTVIDVQVTASGATIPAGGTIIGRINQLTITFDMDVDDPPGDIGTDDVTNPANYMLHQTGPNGVFDTPHCAVGLSGDDVGLASGAVLYDGASSSVAVTINNGNILPDGDYRLFVCGTTSITAGGIALGGDSVNSGTDYLLDFSVVVPESLPDTGFAPDLYTTLPPQPMESIFDAYPGLWLKIPSQEIMIPIVGVPLREGKWDVAWLANQAGWLEGSAFPTRAGNSVLTGHAVNTSGSPGPFSTLDELQFGDEIIIGAWGQQYIYKVRSSWSVDPDDTLSVMRHDDYPWLTLLTCRGYDPTKDSYLYRTVVRAIQVDIQNSD